MFSVVTDSLADLPASVPFAPVRILVDGKEFLGKVNIRTEDVVRYVREGKRLSTAGASVKGWVDAIRSVPKGDVLAITFSSKLSGSYNAALSAARILSSKGYNVHVLDSLAGSIAQGLLVMKALEMRDLDVGEALERLLDLRSRLRLFMTVPDLAYLARSGRVSWAKALLGKLIGAFPIITLKDGELVHYKTVRGMENVISFMKERLGKKEGLVGHVLAPEHASQVSSGQPIVPVAPGIAVHVGPGAFGVAFFD